MSYDFVSVHVGLRTGTGLVNLQWEVLAQIFIAQSQQFINGFNDQVTLFFRNRVGFHVSLSSCLLNVQQCTNNSDWHVLASWEVVTAPFSLRTPQSIGRDLNWT